MPPDPTGVRRTLAGDLTTLPNLLTIFRVVGILGAAAIYYGPGWFWPTLALGTAAGATDLIDGRIARATGTTSEVGRVLDVLADLLFVFTCLSAAVERGLWPLYLLLAWGVRDLGILALRASAADQGFVLPSSRTGKVATTVLFLALLLMFFDLGRPFGPGPAADVVSWVALVGVHAGIGLSWLAGIGYVRTYALRYGGR